MYYWLIAPRETDCFSKQEVLRTLSKTLREGLLGGINNKSRMMREYHVRICEKLGGKFPGFTRRSNWVCDLDLAMLSLVLIALLNPF